ncbi:hypothetical protein CF319_g910 [Tilletia indica]|nr:hypothetical protein CF319_g910 [Tilletia indica]
MDTHNQVGQSSSSSSSSSHHPQQGHYHSQQQHHHQQADSQQPQQQQQHQPQPQQQQQQQQQQPQQPAMSYSLAELPSTSGFPAASADPAAYARAGAFANGAGGVDPFYPLGIPAVHHMGKRPHNPNAPPRLYKCSLCPASFSRNHDLKRHSRIHLAVKPFPCQFCEKSFSRKDALKRHVLVKGCGTGNKKERSDKGKQRKAKASQQTTAPPAERNNGVLPNGSVTGVPSASTASPVNKANSTISTGTNPYEQPSHGSVHASDFGLGPGGGGTGPGGGGGGGVASVASAPIDNHLPAEQFYPTRGGTTSLMLGSPYGPADVGRESNGGGLPGYIGHGTPSAYGGGPSARTGLPMSVSSSAGSSWYNSYGPGGGPNGGGGGGGGGEGSGGSAASLIRSRDSTYDTDSYASSLGHPSSAHTPRAETPHSHQHPHAHGHPHGGYSHPHQTPHPHPHHPHHGPHPHLTGSTGGSGGAGTEQSYASPQTSHPYSPQTGAYSGYGAFYPGGSAGHSIGAISNTVTAAGTPNGFDPAGPRQQPHYTPQQQQHASPYSNTDSVNGSGGGGHDVSGGAAAPNAPLSTWWRP